MFLIFQSPLTFSLDCTPLFSVPNHYIGVAAVTGKFSSQDCQRRNRRRGQRSIDYTSCGLKCTYQSHIKASRGRYSHDVGKKIE